MSKQRDNCQQCLAPTLTVYVGSRRTVLDWPWAEHGDIAVYATVGGTYSARFCPVGETLHAAEKRFQVHSCGEPKQDLSEPLRAPEGLRGEAWQAAMKAAQSQRNAVLRRPRPRVKPITGYRRNPGGSK